MAGSILDKVDVLDGGDKIILSCEDETTLHQVIEEMKKEGARGANGPTKVGRKWIASFERPGAAECTIEKFGFEIVITGSTEEDVLARSLGFRERGALIVRGPEQEDGKWKLYLDDVGRRTGTIVTG
jgi:hypothetical protein